MLIRDLGGQYSITVSERNLNRAWPHHVGSKKLYIKPRGRPQSPSKHFQSIFIASEHLHLIKASLSHYAYCFRHLDQALAITQFQRSPKNIYISDSKMHIKTLIAVSMTLSSLGLTAPLLEPGTFRLSVFPFFPRRLN